MLMQATRKLMVETPLGPDAVQLRDLRGHEELSRLFEFRLTLLSQGHEADPRGMVGHNITFAVLNTDESARYFNGYVSEFRFVGHSVNSDAVDEKIIYNYEAVVVPWLWLLKNRVDCRIFQHKTTVEIVEEVFSRAGFSDFDTSQLTGNYLPREYCVQYRESDFDFVSRLLEEEGIFYYFQHENGQHTLMLCDNLASYQELSDGQVEFGSQDTAEDIEQLTHWEHLNQFHSGSWCQNDYNFKTPSEKLVKDSISQNKLPNKKFFEVFEYPARVEDATACEALTKIRMEQEEVAYDVIQGAGNYRSFAPAGTFQVKAHLRAAEIGKKYVLTRVEYDASVGDSYLSLRGGKDSFRVENRFVCIPQERVFRPRRTTPRPIVEGPQTAVVVGPPGEEIYPDEFGRIKVQFHWDREGSRDENSSCWIRNSQIHAGNGWGSISLPRVGEEVIVSFLNGDPDRPIIKGRVYNAEVTPPFGLPGEMTRSGLKSDTHKGSGYNEMSMDDTAGQEQIRVNAQNRHGHDCWQQPDAGRGHRSHGINRQQRRVDYRQQFGHQDRQ